MHSPKGTGGMCVEEGGIWEMTTNVRGETPTCNKTPILVENIV